MWPRPRALTAAFLLAILVVPTSALARVGLALTYQGIERTATLHLPGSRVQTPAPVIIALHGLDQTTDSLRAWLHLNAIADRNGVIVVYPEAINGRWSYGRPIGDPMPTVGGETVDDVGYIRTLID